ncbi:hypothetical protein [Demequina litorisediminis]|nr:hypothetical protein [Demequina litorisediminis]
MTFDENATEEQTNAAYRALTRMAEPVGSGPSRLPRQLPRGSA